MSNALTIRNKLDVSEFNEDELEIIQQQINERRINKLSIKLEQVENLVLKNEEKIGIMNEEINNRFDDLQADNDKKLEVTINTYRVSQNKWGFGSQSDFGIRFRVSIGSGTVGKLFRVIGLAKKSKTGKTEPCRDAILSKKATTEIINGFETIRWHHEKCLKVLEDWLSKHELLEEFYSIDKEKDLQKYINNLFDRYIDED